MQQSDMAQRRGSDRTVWGFYTACLLLFVLFVTCIFLILNYSVRQAEGFGVAIERKLVQRELQREIDMMVRYQSDVSFWDATVAQVRARAFNEFFVQRHLEDGLWRDYGFSWMVFSTGAHQTKLAMRNGKVTQPGAADMLLFWVDDLIRQANDKYHAVLKPADGGYRISMQANDRDLLVAPIANIHAADMRMVDGVMSIVVVQAVVPRNLFIPDRYLEPVFMVSVKPVTSKMLDKMSERLAISGLRVVKGEGTALNVPSYSPVGNNFTDGPFVVTWTPNSPGPYILNAALPRVLVLSLLAAVSLGFIAFRFGAVVRALQHSEAANRFLAKHDGLTGLVNRIGLDEHLHAYLAEAGEVPFAVLALDLDKFKAVNDRHGHAAGDAVLTAVSNRFRARVGRGGVVARLGGDEFLVLIRDARSTAEVMSIAHGLVLDAQQPVEFENLPLCVGCSAGVAIFPYHAVNARGIIQAADMALYAAKNGGRNRAVLAGTAPLSRDVAAH